ncbi:AAA domain-containing protein [Bacillus cereus]|uniref:DEAD/DEAH box helicase n=3 Tax=Bacillus cereus TaxID=1396 RepID=UPI00192DBE95|nr:AAA domain-containing protein [Bacillus cereus]MDA2328235.1 AAA domain-containing protein [Bacillus cereus]MDA2334033.1 AAA domain-containing protein [Bacillus cereus]MDA2358396.1 AAA domain-containing protein [Bacillus cereus]
MSKPEKIIEAWWHLETLAPGQIQTKYLKEPIAKKYLKKESYVKKFSLFKGAEMIEFPQIWQQLELKSEQIQKRFGFYGNVYYEHELTQYQRYLHKVKEEIINPSFTICFSYYVEFDKGGKYIDESLFIPYLQLYIKLMEEHGGLQDVDFMQLYNEHKYLLNTQANAINGGLFNDQWLDEFNKQFKQFFGTLPRSEIYVLECILKQEQDEENMKFNSFFTEDLLYAKNDLNDTLATFLTPAANQQDINENREYIEYILHPDRLPLGRWPSPIKHRLSLMQQVAVNEFFVSNTPVSSVNGPPGTGKTTLLQDIFAEIVVKKADSMTRFRDNVNDMIKKTSLKEKIPHLFKENEEVERFIYEIAPSITKHAIVVASSNNGAVENISKELPQQKKVDGCFLEELMTYQYAPKTAKKMISQDSWGLFSVALGNSSNIKKAAQQLLNRKFSVMTEWNKSKAARDEAKENWKTICDEFIQLKNEVEAEKYAILQMMAGRKEADETLLQSTDDFWTASNYEKRQQSVLFQTDNLNIKRSKLFIKAIHVLNHFILIHGEKLRAALSILEKKNTLDLNQKESIEKLHIMWHTVHCFFPVVSTTFASFASMYRGINKDFIPYLMIDEAGQAVPSQAVGALWRSQKVMVVGDPLQIEPVVTTDNTMLEDLRKIYKLKEDILGIKCSVQSVADRSNHKGSFVQDNRWIGMPLWVHRRCLEPMFSMANELAYGGKMVLGNEGIGKSEWYDVKGKVSTQQFVKEQAVELEQKLEVYWKQRIQYQLLMKMWELAGNEPAMVLKELFYEHFMAQPETSTELDVLSLQELFKQFISYSPQLRLEEFENLLTLIADEKLKPPSIYIITPFTAVKNETIKYLKRKDNCWTILLNTLKRELRHDGIDEDAEAHRKLLINIAQQENDWYTKWVSENIGTVHTFQGKEAEVVFFITGTDHTKKTAAEWACKEPNILNVAITRAKKEFYIIGDLQLLKEYPNYQIILNNQLNT